MKGVDHEDFYQMNNLNEDIPLVLEIRLTIGDDHMPADENVPSATNNYALIPSTSLYQEQK
jgi:hypothetical protein